MKRTLNVFLLIILLLPLFNVHAETDTERRKRIEGQLQVVERQILQQRLLVEDKQIERQSLERDIDIINSNIKQAELGIEARELAIEELTDQIGSKAETIVVLNDKLTKQKQTLSEIMRQTKQVDDVSLVEILLSKKNFSDFFSEVDSFHAVKDSLNDSLSVLSEIKTDTEQQKDSLLSKQSQEAEMKGVQELERERIEEQENAKQKILTVTKGEEKAYQQLLQQQEKSAAQLRAQLFDLLGGGGGIPFPEAVALAKTAGSLAGISPALVLAILEQETNYGNNLGSCVYNDTIGGRPVMHPDRDAPVFLAIAGVLGFDPNRQQVSCPLIQGGVPVGWGGAMGPSQFIPSTWAIYGGISNGQYVASADAIRTLTGKNTPANPFNNLDAFLATALLLRDNGGASSPRLAALRYYAGWGGASRPENQFYGDQVVQRMTRLQREIEILGD